MKNQKPIQSDSPSPEQRTEVTAIIMDSEPQRDFPPLPRAPRSWEIRVGLYTCSKARTPCFFTGYD